MGSGPRPPGSSAAAMSDELVLEIKNRYIGVRMPYGYASIGDCVAGQFYCILDGANFTPGAIVKGRRLHQRFESGDLPFTAWRVIRRVEYDEVQTVYLRACDEDPERKRTPLARGFWYEVLSD